MNREHSMVDHDKQKERQGSLLSRFTRMGGHELLILLASLLVAGSIWLFVGIADEMTEGDYRQFDENLLLALRNPQDLSDAIGPAWFEEMMRDFTALGGTAVLVGVTLAVLGFLLLQRKKGMTVFMLCAVVGGFVLSSSLKHLFDRPRPDLVPHQTYVMSASFPSGHSMVSAVVYLTLGGLLARYIRDKRMKIYVLTLAVLTTVIIGCSRVYLGVHWPTDVLAGWTAGTSWALLCWLVALVLQQRGQVEQDIEE